MGENKDRYLFISDLQIPFEAERALDFCAYVKRHYRIPSENVFCVGDEVDQAGASMHGPKDPNGYSPGDEFEISKKKLKPWFKKFPEMKIAVSNHGQRWARKASHAELPSQMLRYYHEALEFPEGWQLKYKWEIKAKNKLMTMVHGMGYSGVNGHRNAAIDFGTCAIIGHLHSNAAISYIYTGEDGSGDPIQKLWAMNVGSLIDRQSYAFKYARASRMKAVNAVGIVLDGGNLPILLPYD